MGEIVEWGAVLTADSLAVVVPDAMVDTAMVLGAAVFVVVALNTVAAPSSTGPAPDSMRTHPCPQHEPDEFSFPSFVFGDWPQKIWNLESLVAVDDVRCWVEDIRMMEIVE